MADLPKTLQDVLDGIIAERGGQDAFDVKAMLAARGLVRLMATLNNGDISKASGIAALEALLPPKPVAPAKAVEPLVVQFVDPRLASLSDQELSEMERIVCKMNGTLPEDIELPPEVAEFVAANEMLRAENERLRADLDLARKRHEDYVLTSERERARLANQGTNVPDIAATVTPTSPAPTNEKVVPLRPPASVFVDPDPYHCGGGGRQRG